MSITVTQAAMADLVDHAETGAPRQVCGVLAGDRDADRVRSVHRADNAADDPRTGYRIAPEQLYAILERIDDAGADPVGFYHSHPEGPGDPLDEAGATWVGAVYLIVDCSAGPSVSAWRATESGFSPEDLELW